MSFQWILSDFFFFLIFRFSRRKSQSQTKPSKKDHSFYNIVLLKKPHLFREPELDWHWKFEMIWTLKWLWKFSSKHVSVWCQKKHLHCNISWRPRTVFLKLFDSKYLCISAFLRKKMFIPKMRSESGKDWIIP